MVFTTLQIKETFCELLKKYGWVNSDTINKVHFNVNESKVTMEFIYEDIEFEIVIDLKDVKSCTSKKQLQKLFINEFVDQIGSYSADLMKSSYESEQQMSEFNRIVDIPEYRTQYYDEWRKQKGEEQIKLEELAPYLSYETGVMYRDLSEYHLYDD